MNSSGLSTLSQQFDMSKLFGVPTTGTPTNSSGGTQSYGGSGGSTGSSSGSGGSNG